MSDAGYLYWEEQPTLNLGGVWLDGRLFENWLEEESGPLEGEREDGVNLLATHGRTNIVQIPYCGSDAPLVGDSRVFRTAFLADDLADYRRLQGARAVGRPVYYCPGVWAAEAFPAVAGQTYRLTRPLAAGIVAGVTAESHPVFLELSGAAAPAAATVSGQTVTAVSTGELIVHYMPAFLVVILGLRESIATANSLILQMTLSETVVKP